MTSREQRLRDKAFLNGAQTHGLVVRLSDALELESELADVRELNEKYRRTNNARCDEIDRLDTLLREAQGVIEKMIDGPHRGAPWGDMLDKIDAALAKPIAHTDHPLRHFDRTCPACLVESEQNAPDAIPVADILAEIEHIKDNSSRLRAFGGMEDEARCRVLCAMYLEEFIHSKRIGDKLRELGALRRGQSARQPATETATYAQGVKGEVQ